MFKTFFINPLLNYTIKFKLRLTYALFMIVVLAGSGIFIYNGYKQKNTITMVTQESTPIINHLQSIREGISELSAMSGLYLLTREQEYQDKYQQVLKSLQQHISSLESRKGKYQTMVQSLQIIKTKLQQLDSNFLHVMKVGTNDALNKPALQLAAVEIGPFFNQVLQVTSSMIDSESEVEEQSVQRKKILQTIYEIRTQWLSLSRNITVYLTYRDKSFAEQFSFQLAKLKGTLILLTESEDELTFEQATGLEELQTIFDGYSQALGKLVPLHSGDGWRKDSQLIRDELGPLLKEIRQDIDKIVYREQSLATQQIEQTLDDIELFSQNTIIIAAISIIGAVFIIFSLNILVNQRLTSTQKAMHEISSGGGLGHTLDETGKDELSIMAVDFNSFVSKIKKIVDLVIFSSSNLAKEASRMSTITECALELSTTQEQKVTEVSEINTEMSEQMVSIAQNAGEAAGAIEKAKATAEQGRINVLQAIESVQEIASEVENSTLLVNELAEDTDSISSVISVIQSISQQTNLLALNAAIEAARAGDAGRGFAVVADEVRNLSHKIQEETITITDKIELLQNASSGVVAKMSSMQENTEKTVVLSSQAGESFDEIVSAITTVTTMNQQNAEATEQQRQNNKKVSDALTHLTIMSQTMAKTSQDAYSSGNEFKIMAEQLKDIVKQFLQESDSTDQPLASERSDVEPVKQSAAVQQPSSQLAKDEGDIELF